MPARLKLVGPTNRHSIFLYKEDVRTIEVLYPDFNLSGFVRELIHRHCEVARQKNTERKHANPEATKSTGASAG